MNKYSFTFIAGLFDELKTDYKNIETIHKIRSILNTETSIPCHAIAINKSTQTDVYYGMIVFPKIILDKQQGLKIVSYVVEIQKQMLDMLNGEQLTAMLIHDISHNVLTFTAIERYKSAIYQACKMTHMKVPEVLYNIDNNMRDIAMMDICNRSYKEFVYPSIDMYEPDRILIDMEIYNQYNSAIKLIHNSTINEDMKMGGSEDLADTYMGTQLVKMVREKLKGITRTLGWLKKYVDLRYDTNIFKMYPSVEIDVKEEQFGQRVSEIEELKPFELRMLKENTIENMKRVTSSLNESSLILESVFKQKRPSTTALQKELDIISFKMQEVSSNYERLVILDRIYDNIYTIEKYLDSNPNDEIIKAYFDKFIDLPNQLKQIRPAKKQYGVFIEYPAGYKG